MQRGGVSAVAGLAPALVLALLLGLLVVTPSRAATTAPTRLVDRAVLGAYVDGMTADPSLLTAFEAQLGAPLGIASIFYGFGDEFPAATERALADGGRRDVLLSWDMGPTRFADWTAGTHDAYLRRIGALAAGYPYPVYVRPWPEMNGDWQPFQPTPAGERPYGGTPAEFVAAWRHVVSTVRAAGGSRVRWVFDPTADVYPGTTDVRSIWPGSRYVDVLGVDGYNWGDGGALRWRSFTDVFAAQYRNLTALDRRLPVWVCEFGSKEPAYDDGAPADPARSKADWLRAALTTTAFPRVTGLVTFEVRKERDWRLSSSPAALDAVRALLAPAVRTASARPGGRGLRVRWSAPATHAVARVAVLVAPRAGAAFRRVASLGAGRRTWRAGGRLRPARAAWVAVRAEDRRGHVLWRTAPARVR